MISFSVPMSLNYCFSLKKQSLCGYSGSVGILNVVRDSVGVRMV